VKTGPARLLRDRPPRHDGTHDTGNLELRQASFAHAAVFAGSFCRAGLKPTHPAWLSPALQKTATARTVGFVGLANDNAT